MLFASLKPKSQDKYHLLCGPSSFSCIFKSDCDKKLHEKILVPRFKFCSHLDSCDVLETTEAEVNFILDALGFVSSREICCWLRMEGEIRLWRLRRLGHHQRSRWRHFLWQIQSIGTQDGDISSVSVVQCHSMYHSGCQRVSQSRQQHIRRTRR